MRHPLPRHGQGIIRKVNTMKFDFVLSREQQALAESNLLVIDKVISQYIHTNESMSLRTQTMAMAASIM